MRIRAHVFGCRDDGEKFNIGGALVRRASQKGFDITGIVTSDTVRVGGRSIPLSEQGNPDEALAILEQYASKPDIVFIAIPPMDRGQVALRYKLHYLEQGIPVVSAEKRAAAYHTLKLIKHLPILGCDAMVGGNALPISTSRSRRIRHDRVKILMVANGTANFGLSERQRGHALATACEKSSLLGYAEPGDGKGDGPHTQFQGELCGDIPSKTVVYHNFACVAAEGPFMTPDEIRLKDFRPDDLDGFTDLAARYRYFVEFNNTEKRCRFDGTTPGSFYVEKGQWKISGGFLNVPKGTFLGDWAPDGVDNGLLIEYVEGHNGPVQLTAPGAGWGPTTDTMFQNAAEVLNLPY